MTALALILAVVAVLAVALAVVVFLKRTNNLARLYREMYHQASLDRQHIMDSEQRLSDYEKALAKKRAKKEATDGDKG